MGENLLFHIDALSELTALKTLALYKNSIEDLGAIVDNPGIGSGDAVTLDTNPLDCENPKIIEDIAALKNRGVELRVDCD